MLTEKDYCDYDTCVALAKLGFPRWELPYDILSKKYCLRLYDAQKWLREYKKIHISIQYVCLKEDVFMYTLRHIGLKLREPGALYNNNQYSSYEEALSEGIKEAVKILKNV